MPPSGYMFSPGPYQASTTPTFMEDLEDPNPPVDPETVNREFYQLDKVRETVCKPDTLYVANPNAYPIFVQVLFTQLDDVRWSHSELEPEVM